jgi:chromosome segregation ATPase
MNNRTSAMDIIDVFASEHTSKVPVALELQEEMVDHQKSLDDTQAGEALVTELREQSERHRRELLEVKEEMKEALAAHDRESAGFLERSQREMERKIAQLQEEREELKVNVQQLIEAKNIMNETLIANNQMSTEKLRKHKEDVQLEIKRLHQEREGLESNVRTLREESYWAREQQKQAEEKQKQTEQKQRQIEEKMALLRQEQTIRVPYSYMPHVKRKPVKGLSICGDSFIFLGDLGPSP